MREPQLQTAYDDEATLVVSGEETTRVAPRFDTEEALVARPVVPLEGAAQAAAPEHADALPAPDLSRPYAPRRRGMLALALVSVLVGGVLGGAGLYLYQRQSQDPAVTPAAAATTETETPADAAQAPAAPAAESNAETSAGQAEAPAVAAPDAEAAAPPAPDQEVPAAPAASEPRSVPASERRDAPAEGAAAGTIKRGKKGDADAEVERRAAPRPDGVVARAEQPEARQVDTIFYRQRRAERRAERRAARRARRGEDVDRLRRIFEGAPE